MTFFNWCKDHYHRHRARKIIKSISQLPTMNDVKDLSVWVDWFDENSNTFTFDYYNPRLGHMISCYTKFNTIDEYIDNLGILIQGISKITAIRLNEITLKSNKETNLDYFLTNKLNKPIDIKTVYSRLLGDIKRLNREIHNLEDKTKSTYYHGKTHQLLDDLPKILIALVIASDQIGIKYLGTK